MELVNANGPALQALRDWAPSKQVLDAALQETPKRLYGFEEMKAG